MAKPKAIRYQFDPNIECLVRQTGTSSDRVRAKLGDRYRWCFCELCWRPTEYSAILQAPEVIKCHARGNAKTVGRPASLYATAQKKADALVARYEQALEGKFGRFGAPRILRAYCDVSEMRGDFSVSSFRDHVERRMLLTEWARHGKLVWLTRPRGQLDGAAKPSRFYCESHNPRRSNEARRAYQRDRRFVAEYEELIGRIWRQGMNSAILPAWDIEAHADVRREAYRQLQALKAPKAPAPTIDDFLAQGMSQAEIARQLKVSRQAISAVIKRRDRKGAMR